MACAPYVLPSPSEPTEGGPSARHDAKQHVVHETMPRSLHCLWLWSKLLLRLWGDANSARPFWIKNKNNHMICGEHVFFFADRFGFAGGGCLCEIKPSNSSTDSNQSRRTIGVKVSISVLYFAEQGLARLHFEVCVLLSVSLISLFSPSSWLWRQINGGMGSGWI